MDVVDLELGLHRRDAEAYEFEIRFSTPDSDAEARVAARVPVGINDLKVNGQTKFDVKTLVQTKYDVDEYGRKLFKYLFADPAVIKAFAKARGIADERSTSLRVRLLVGPTAPELHSLFWEAIRDPSDGSPLFTGERVLFSRYLSSADWRPVRRRAKGNLRALVAVANPNDLETYKLAALDVSTEMARAKAGLEGIACTELASGGTATLDGVMRGLQDGCDILYLMCHGALIQDEGDQVRRAWLWLEDETAKTHKVLASEFIQRIGELRNPPALIVLASCQSAGAGSEVRTSDAGVLASIGPGLAVAGVPAILAMQGDVTIATVAKFMPAFFRELQRDGQIDRAAAVARGAIRDRDDWYVPVLFMRLRGGCLWYAPGFEAEAGLENWDAVIQQIGDNHWTPIIGPGLNDALLGSRREIARRWADTFHFPMAPYNREDLPQVAQYVAVKQHASTFPQNELIQYLGKELSAHFGDRLSDELRNFKPSQRFPVGHVSRMISVLGSQQRMDNPAEPFRVLAKLPLPIYVTAAQNNLMADALRDAKKQPRVEFCRWNDDLLELPGIYGKNGTEPGFRPESGTAACLPYFRPSRFSRIYCDHRGRLL